MGVFSEEVCMKRAFLVLFACMLLLIGCDWNPGSALTSTVTWRSSDSSKLTTARTIQEPDSIVTPYYQDYGSLVATVTPSKFKIPLQAVELSNEKQYVNPIPFHQFDEGNQKWIVQYGDFTENNIASPGLIPVDTYTDFLFFFFDSAGSMQMSSTPGINALYSNEIVMDLPDTYAGLFPITDQIKRIHRRTNTEGEPVYELYDLVIDGSAVYETKVVDAQRAIYQVELSDLLPGPITNGVIQGKKLTVFWFNGDETVTYDVPQGQTWHELFDYKTTPGMGTKGNTVFTRLPWEGVEIHKKAARVAFEIYWDLQDIIEIYDNNTPNILTDDIAVLADTFWERIEISVRQYDKNGVKL